MQRQTKLFSFLLKDVIERKSCSQSAAHFKHWVLQQWKPCHQSSDSFLVRPGHSYLMNATMTEGILQASINRLVM